MAHKFHINGSGEIRPCSATVRPCRFKGFESTQEAESYLSETNNSGLASLSKPKPIPEQILAKLQQFGIARGITAKSSESEVIEKAFNGNRASYKNFVQLSARGNEELKSGAMKGIGKFVSKGVAVDTTTEFNTVPAEKNSEKFDKSEVDLLETPSQKDIAKTLVQEFGKPF